MLYLLVIDSDSSNPYQLWKTDGSSQHAVKVKDLITPGDYDLFDFEALQGKIYISFMQYYYDTGREIWESDGTEASTLLLFESHTYGYPTGDPELESAGGALFLIHATDNYGSDLWKHCP
jgi:hypothetical protein